ncbi:hypothetical protein Tco_0823204 [Tanacetum coccineum]|uniref:Uncharacterized protein n=1 Tax=Tanacetum coccineum TaxID=301880 RepID=A0ABQ5AH94_9ASTR
MPWGIVTRLNVDYAELLWEEFVQGIQTFFSHQASLSITSKKSTPHVIPYCRFTKMIIYYLGSKYNIHRRPEYPVHVTGDEFPLGNLKRTPVTEEASTRPSAKPQDDTFANVVRDTPSPADAETRADTDKNNSKGDTEILDVDED